MSLSKKNLFALPILIMIKNSIFFFFCELAATLFNHQSLEVQELLSCRISSRERRRRCGRAGFCFIDWCAHRGFCFVYLLEMQVIAVTSRNFANVHKLGVRSPQKGALLVFSLQHEQRRWRGFPFSFLPIGRSLCHPKSVLSEASLMD